MKRRLDSRTSRSCDTEKRKKDGRPTQLDKVSTRRMDDIIETLEERTGETCGVEKVEAMSFMEREMMEYILPEVAGDARHCEGHFRVAGMDPRQAERAVPYLTLRHLEEHRSSKWAGDEDDGDGGASPKSAQTQWHATEETLQRLAAASHAGWLRIRGRTTMNSAHSDENKTTNGDFSECPELSVYGKRAPPVRLYWDRRLNVAEDEEAGSLKTNYYTLTENEAVVMSTGARVHWMSSAPGRRVHCHTPHRSLASSVSSMMLGDAQIMRLELKLPRPFWPPPPPADTTPLSENSGANAQCSHLAAVRTGVTLWTEHRQQIPCAGVATHTSVRHSTTWRPDEEVDGEEMDKEVDGEEMDEEEMDEEEEESEEESEDRSDESFDGAQMKSLVVRHDTVASRVPNRTSRRIWSADRWLQWLETNCNLLPHRLLLQRRARERWLWRLCDAFCLVSDEKARIASGSLVSKMTASGTPRTLNEQHPGVLSMACDLSPLLLVLDAAVDDERRYFIRLLFVAFENGTYERKRSSTGRERGACPDAFRRHPLYRKSSDIDTLWHSLEHLSTSHLGESAERDKPNQKNTSDVIAPSHALLLTHPQTLHLPIAAQRELTRLNVLYLGYYYFA